MKGIILKTEEEEDMTYVRHEREKAVDIGSIKIKGLYGRVEILDLYVGLEKNNLEYGKMK